MSFTMIIMHTLNLKYTLNKFNKKPTEKTLLILFSTTKTTMYRYCL